MIDIIWALFVVVVAKGAGMVATASGNIRVAGIVFIFALILAITSGAFLGVG